MDRRDYLRYVSGISLGIAGSGCFGCRSAPVTGRRQMVLLNEPQEISLGAQAFHEVLQEERLSTNRQRTELVERVGQRIANVSGRNDYQWEFKLVDSPTQNAFALPGGKVAIYEGILPVCKNEAGLAVVMSHEVAHALARHGGERMSQTIAVDTVKGITDRIAMNRVPEQHERLMQAYGIATQYGVILPYSRKHELEADHIGIMLMSRAGYDPQEAPRFWNRFASAKGGPETSEFFSTHPSDARRAAALETLLQEARQLYDAAPYKFSLGELIV
ncbi:MAG TPA: M48 family metallopeptidase [Pirellulaceae bacterium]|nr:M48 family metallopeptidase [Pirellulaceae bacterium]HMO93169.1 M48 family metallopeptidase [Pirellulaceae bacterium]HMP70002.1 M48 family metallopeptidase [Pirellulaceae bacterium]